MYTYTYIYVYMHIWYIECKEETRQEEEGGGGINDGREEQPFFNIHIRLEHA